MDYARIYAEFIADRLAKQPEKPAYFEVHHIKPRSLGGGNEPENLIRLTPEDHLFAHLLLAKVNGGKMWVAVHAMCYLLNDSTGKHRKYANRTKFGYVRRALADHYRESFKGPAGPQADKDKYTLRHHDGRKAIGNRFELEQQTGIPRQQISALLLGSKKTNRGWYYDLHNPDGLTRSELLSLGLRSSDVHKLYHYDGREWQGTKSEFSKEFGAKLYFQTERGDVLGWHRSIEDAKMYIDRLVEKAKKASSARGSIDGHKNPNADARKYRFLVVKTNQVIEATKIEAKMLFGIRSPDICALFSGRQKTAKGVALVKP